MQRFSAFMALKSMAHATSSLPAASHAFSTMAGSHVLPESGLQRAAPGVSIIGAPTSLGQRLAGAAKGPTALRFAGLENAIADLGYTVTDMGDAVIPSPTTKDPSSAFAGRNSYAVGTGNRNIADMAEKASQAGNFVLTLGGDHSVAMGSIAGIMAARPDLGVVWVDAHADINEPSTSSSGNIHGMPLSFLMRLFDPMEVPGCGWLGDARYPVLTPDRVVYVGLRDLDTPEQLVIRNLGIRAFTMSDVDRYGIGEVMERAIHHLTSKVRRPLHLSFDIDAVDPAVAPSTGTTVPGGLTFREAHYVCEAVASTGLLGSMDIVEINPDLVPGSGAMATVKLGIHLVASALGKSVLPALSQSEAVRIEKEAASRQKGVLDLE